MSFLTIKGWIGLGVIVLGFLINAWLIKANKRITKGVHHCAKMELTLIRMMFIRKLGTKSFPAYRGVRK